jgi:hypothetical protein
MTVNQKKEKRKYKIKDKVNKIHVINHPSKISFECSNIEQNNITDFESDIDKLSFKDFIILYYPNFQYLFELKKFKHLF